MSKFLVTYDLKKPGKDYSTLIEKIKKYTYSKVCESAWIVKTSDSASSIRDNLSSCMDTNDRLFVGELSGTAAWQNCIDTSENIKKILE